MEIPMTIIDTIWEPHTFPTPYYKPSTIAGKPLHRPHPNTNLHNIAHGTHTHLPWHQVQHAHTTLDVCPETDISETAAAYHIEMALPGVSDKDSLDIQWRGSRTLVVQSGLACAEASGGNCVGSPPNGKFGEITQKVAVSGNLSNGDKAELTKMRNGDFAHHQQNGHAGKVEIHEADHTERLYILKERRTGAFQRTFTLPVDIDVEGCKARLEHGLLRIDVPKMKAQERLEERLTLDDT